MLPLIFLVIHFDHVKPFIKAPVKPLQVSNQE